MKIALCLSGQPRFVKEVAPYIIENICKGNVLDRAIEVFYKLKMDKTNLSNGVL